MSIAQTESPRTFQAVRPRGTGTSQAAPGGEPARPVQQNPEAERIQARLASVHTAAAGRLGDVFANLI
ncbi:MAG: hypothetical protein AMXMBFR58_30290 [Phycisphaerae bacterium]|nr:hypothetical protein [Phycisphaerales bacterium]